MPSLHLASLRRVLLKVVTVGGIVAMTVVAMRVFGPRQTAAQSAQQGEVRATSFVLVGADGTVLGRLAAGPAGNGNLTLSDVAGKPRNTLAGSGALLALDGNGTLRMSAGYRDATVEPFVSLYGENGPGSSFPCIPRVALRRLATDSYCLQVCDANGNVTYIVP